MRRRYGERAADATSMGAPVAGEEIVTDHVELDL